MLARKNRLTEKNDFLRVEKLGQMYQSDNFGASYYNRNDGNPSRFAFVVSTKISKDASDRNRFKRVMSESVRTSSIDIRDGYDVVFLAKTSITRVPTDFVMKEVKKALKEMNLVK